MMNNSPCPNCTKRDPETCEYKMCVEWREWFLAKWDELRAKLGPRFLEDEDNGKT